jgi:hypothetical protein
MRAGDRYRIGAAFELKNTVPVQPGDLSELDYPHLTVQEGSQRRLHQIPVMDGVTVPV